MSSLNWTTPLQMLLGSTPDISALLRFAWWEPVYYKLDDSDFPSASPERLGRFVGIAEHVGHTMTFHILTDDTHRVLCCSNVRSALDPDSANLRAASPDGEDSPEIIKSVIPAGGSRRSSLQYVDPTDLIGRTFLTEPQADGQRFCAHIVKALEDKTSELHSNPNHIKFVCSINNDTYGDIVAYTDILSCLEADEEEEHIWKF